MLSCADLRVVLLAITGWLTACASPSGPISLSISELGSEVQEDAGSLIAGIRHRRSYNITGLGSSETVGMLTADPDPPLLFRWGTLFSRPTLPDQLAPRISPQCSRVAVHDLPMAAGKGMPEVIRLRDSLNALHSAQVNLQRARAQALLLAEIVATYTGAPADAAASAAAPAPDRSAARRALLVQAWRAMDSGADVPADSTGWSKRQEEHSHKLVGMQNQHHEALESVRSARQEQGLIVARWEYEASSQGGLAAIGINAEARQAQTRSGFVVMGHPRTLTMISGNDLMARACGSEGATCNGGIVAGSRTGIDSMIPPRRLYTTTFQLLARHLAWAESGSAEQQVALKAQLSEIIGAASAAGLESFKAKLEALKVDVGHASRSATAGENLGAVSGAVHWEVPFTFWREPGYARSVAYLRALNGEFMRVSSMRTTLDAYASRYGGTLASAEADRCENKGPSDEDVLRVTRVHLACDRPAAPATQVQASADAHAAEQAQRQERCMALGAAPAQGAQTAALVAQP